MAKRCYLCSMALGLVEHPDESRKYYIRCMLDNKDHVPCDYCGLFEEGNRTILMEGDK